MVSIQNLHKNANISIYESQAPRSIIIQHMLIRRILQALTRKSKQPGRASRKQELHWAGAPATRWGLCLVELQAEGGVEVRWESKRLSFDSKNQSPYRFKIVSTQSQNTVVQAAKKGAELINKGPRTSKTLQPRLQGPSPSQFNRPMRDMLVGE